MPGKIRELIVFPTELSLRRYQQEQALQHGWVDASGHTTFARLRKLCLPYAEVKGRPISPARELLLRREAVDVASGHFEGESGLGALSDNALSEVLRQLVGELSALPDTAPAIMDWLGAQTHQRRLRQLATLAHVWRAQVQASGYADPFDINLAILRLLRGPREKWPPLLRDCGGITFRSVRWFNPFEELCVAALNCKLSVRVESALPPARAEMSADRLGQRIRSEIMVQPWAVWAEDLSDALAVDSPDLLQQADAVRISFSRSAGGYGEIEDLARRICWNLESGKMPAHRIALVVPNLSTVQDVIPHVFSRFRIPYFFRRGRPVLSSPCVKAFLAWLAFPLRTERDIRIDLVRNPAIQVENREEEAAGLRMQPPLLDRRNYPPVRSGQEALNVLHERMAEPEDHFNREALQVVASVLEELGNQVLPLEELLDLVEAVLADATVKPQDSHEQGVWILNPHDTVGLEFDLVLIAGLNEGEFPALRHQDALLNDGERRLLRKRMEEQGKSLPHMALPEASVQFEQESVRFLCALGMAREQLVFSCQAVDQEGGEKGESDYFRKLWNLAGWGAREEIVLSLYDRWRMQQLDEASIFADHLTIQQHTDPEDRLPMPGESFLPIVPLPLCRAPDEALQAAMAGGASGPAPANAASEAASVSTWLSGKGAAALGHLVAMRHIEAERDAFLDGPQHERVRSPYCGHLPRLQEKIAEWLAVRREQSPSALEVLAQCRYRFLLERILGLEEARAADDMPDPMERGSLIHTILRDIYQAVAEGKAGIDAPRYWAVKTDGGWVKRTAGGVDAVPLAAFLAGAEDQYEAFARQVAVAHLNDRPMGHPGIWSAEREKILEILLNIVRYDAATCPAENRYPALFELSFGGDTAVELDPVCVRGRIDRVDLIFGETGTLKRLRVLDYKGTSRVRNKREEYLNEIRLNLDCQLPVYAFAAQKHLLGAFNTPDTNAMTEAGYLFCQRKYADVKKTSAQSLLPLDEAGLVDGFLYTLGENIRRLKAGDFAVDPLLDGYTDYASICRTAAIGREELELRNA